MKWSVTWMDEIRSGRNPHWRNKGKNCITKVTCHCSFNVWFSLRYSYLDSVLFDGSFKSWKLFVLSFCDESDAEWNRWLSLCGCIIAARRETNQTGQKYFYFVSKIRYRSPIQHSESDTDILLQWVTPRARCWQYWMLPRWWFNIMQIRFRILIA